VQFIIHRRNTIEELKNTSPEYGIEIDIRSYGEHLVVHHEPFVNAVDFEEWIKYYDHKTLILNVKEEGIESRIKEIVERAGIKDYFFLDLSFPALVKMVNTGEKRIAVRFSEYESLETILTLVDKVEWVWVDCFTKMPLTDSIYKILSKQFKLCVVSPELQGRSIEEIGTYKDSLSNFQIDAVCTKRPDLWKR